MIENEEILKRYSLGVCNQRLGKCENPLYMSRKTRRINQKGKKRRGNIGKMLSIKMYYFCIKYSSKRKHFFFNVQQINVDDFSLKENQHVYVIQYQGIFLGEKIVQKQKFYHEKTLLSKYHMKVSSVKRILLICRRNIYVRYSIPTLFAKTRTIRFM